MSDDAKNGSFLLERVGHVDVITAADGERSIRQFSLRASEQPLRLRSYQDELAEPGLAGTNSIVCAPTGSGKTLVAVAVIRKCLEANHGGKVIFFAPTTDLVAQQADLLKDYLGATYAITTLVGNSGAGAQSPPKRDAIRRADIVVMTPEVMRNLLRGNETEEPLQLEDFCLLVFDECHHMDKMYPYNEIMIIYLDKKLDPDFKGKLPQVLGLTASLGTGKANSQSDAFEYAKAACARMDAQKLCTVERHINDLRNHVNFPVDSLEPVPSVMEGNAFVAQLVRIMQEIEQPLVLDLRSIQPPSDYIVSQVPGDRGSQPYTNFIHVNLNHVPAACSDAELKRRIMTRLEHLEVYHNAIDITAHVSAARALEYLNDALTDKESRQTTSLCRELVTLYRRREASLRQIADSALAAVPIAEKLEQLLVKEYTQHAESRTLVFVRTRELTKALMDFMKDRPRLERLNPGRLVGSNVSTEKGGQAPAYQRETLEQFKNGDRKVLVATTVAEEGLDIQMCNLVIKYNHVTNEIAMIQRRGRGRAVNSRSVLLVQDAKLAEKERTNMIRERMMQQAIHDMKALSEERYKAEIGRIQREDLRKRQIEQKMVALTKTNLADKKATVDEIQRKDHEKRVLDRSVTAMTKRNLSDKKFDLLCKKCDTLICASSSVRQVQNNRYVCVDREFWPRSSVSSLGTAMEDFGNIVVAAKLRCKACQRDWGNVVRYKKVFLPTIKAESFVLKQLHPPVPQGKPGRFTFKKWKSFNGRFFVVDEISTANLLDMVAALNPQLVQLEDAMVRMGKLDLSSEEGPAGTGDAGPKRPAGAGDAGPVPKRILENGAASAAGPSGDEVPESNVPVGLLVDL